MSGLLNHRTCRHVRARGWALHWCLAEIRSLVREPEGWSRVPVFRSWRVRLRFYTINIRISFSKLLRTRNLCNNQVTTSWKFTGIQVQAIILAGSWFKLHNASVTLLWIAKPRSGFLDVQSQAEAQPAKKFKHHGFMKSKCSEAHLESIWDLRNKFW